MKMKNIGKKKIGTGMMIVGGILTAVGSIGAVASMFKKDNKNNDVISENEDSIDVCEKEVEELNNNFLEDETEEIIEEI